MRFTTTSFYSILQTSFKLIVGFIIIKLVAKFGGTEGVGEFGLFQNFSTIILMLSGGVTCTAVTKMIAADKKSPEKDLIISTNKYYVEKMKSFCFFFLVPLICIVQLFFLKQSIYNLILFLVAVPLLVLQAQLNIYVSILNGMEMIKELARINILSSLLTISLAFLLCLIFDDWRFIAITVCLGPALFYFFNVSEKYKIRSSLADINSKYLSELKKYALFGIVSAVSLPLVHIIIRDGISRFFSDHHAGLWQGMNRLSEVYLTLISTVISIYIIPKVSSSASRIYTRKIVINTFYLTLVMSIIIILLVYSLRDLLILVLFNEKFKSMSSLFIYQLPGDFFKISSWVFSFALLGIGAVKQILYLELFAAVLYLILSILLVAKLGFQGALVAYTISYFIYLIMTVLLFYRSTRTL